MRYLSSPRFQLTGALPRSIVAQSRYLVVTQAMRRYALSILVALLAAQTEVGVRTARSEHTKLGYDPPP